MKYRFNCGDSAYSGGERIPVAVNRKEYTMNANADFSQFAVTM